MSILIFFDSWIYFPVIWTSQISTYSQTMVGYTDLTENSTKILKGDKDVRLDIGLTLKD